MTATPLVGNTFFGLDLSQLGAQFMSVRRRLSKRLLLLEFSASGLRYAEASPSLDGIRFSHVSFVPLPEEALERGVPSDPAVMAALIKALCQEKQIPAHRAAVVLSPEVAYQRVVELPSGLTLEQAFDYVRNPDHVLPLPFPLGQTDFDLYPINSQKGSRLQSYLLIAVPQVLIDRVINLLNASGFELQALELGPFSLLRFLGDELISLRESELHLVLELLPDCSQLCVVSPSGPVRFERMSAIRDFPEPDLDDQQRQEALAAGISAEEMTLKDERYLPISELDLRAVVRDVKAVMVELMARADSTVVRGLTLSGINSAHPLIKDLFHEALDCPVKVLNPVLMPRVVGFTPDDLLVQAGLARLMGLGLGFLPREQLLSCHRPEVVPPLASVSLPSLAVDSSIDAEDQPSTAEMDPLDVELIVPLSDGVSADSRDGALEKEELEEEEEEFLAEGPEVNEGEEEWPSLGLDVLEKEGLEDVDKEVFAEGPEVNEGEEEWPSLGLDVLEKEGLEDADKEVFAKEPAVSEGEEDWPSINTIPELDTSESESISQESESTSQSTSAVDDSSLGELRFKE